MEETLQIPGTMATHSQPRALSYLVFALSMLVASIVMTGFLMSDLSVHAGSRPSQVARTDFLAVAVLGLVLLGGSLLSLRTAIQNLLTAHSLGESYHQAEGVITHKWVDTFQWRVVYHVSYRFQGDREAWEVISKRLYRSLRKGSRVPVRHLQEDPSIARLNRERISA